MKCRVCRGPAVIDLRQHNANFCVEHFLKFCSDQMAKAIHDGKMFGPDDRILVAVSGGKDSLALWDMLLDAGYHAEGLYLGLGIGDYSDESASHVRRYAERRGATLHVVDLSEQYGYDVPTAAERTRRVPCSACGLSKRHLFNRAALDGGFEVVATGHNLDDEAAVLFGNVLRWETDYLARQHPVLPARDGFVRKVKPLYRLGEREMAAYCVLKGIEYQVDECPMALGNKHMGFKEALNEIEARSPGTKAAFVNTFLARGREPFVAHVAAAAAAESDGEGDAGGVALAECTSCGAPTTNEGRCAFCVLLDRVDGHHPTDGAGQSVPVVVSARPREATS